MNIQTAELDDSRKGSVYFLGQLQIEQKPSFDIGLINNFVSGTSVVSDLKNASSNLIKQVNKGKREIPGSERFIKPVRDSLSSFFDKMTENFLDLYGHNGVVVEWMEEFGTWAISSLVGTLADVIPGWGYVQSASALYDGVKQSVGSAIRWLKQVYSGWGVKLLDGSPTVIASAIAAHNAAGLAGGLKDIAITSAKISLQAAGDAVAGVGSIVNMITGILQRIANLVGYCIQRFLLLKTFNQASYHWDNKAELVTDHERFNAWFKKSCVCTPVIAALTMQSGFVANPMRFLALLTDDDEVISQEAFDKGVKHIEKLKSLSREYCRSYAEAYKLNFKSEDPVVSGRLNNIFV